MSHLPQEIIMILSLSAPFFLAAFGRRPDAVSAG